MKICVQLYKTWTTLESNVPCKQLVNPFSAAFLILLSMLVLNKCTLQFIIVYWVFITNIHQGNSLLLTSDEHESWSKWVAFSHGLHCFPCSIKLLAIIGYENVCKFVHFFTFSCFTYIATRSVTLAYTDYLWIKNYWKLYWIPTGI